MGQHRLLARGLQAQQAQNALGCVPSMPSLPVRKTVPGMDVWLSGKYLLPAKSSHSAPGSPDS